MSNSRREYSNEDLADAYGDVRSRCLDMGRSLTTADAAIMSPCCPVWSVKDLYAHMAGVPVDILENNIDGAATEAWADAHIERRRSDSVAAICAEWAATATPIDELLRSVGRDLTPKFFIDAWTHEWDIRQAVDAGASPDLRLPDYVAQFLLTELTSRADDVAPAVLLTVRTPTGPLTTELGSGTPTSTASIGLFDFARVTMGRRSLDQITELIPTLDPEVMVFWSANDQRIDDPAEA